jgi:kinesin family protein C1
LRQFEDTGLAPLNRAVRQLTTLNNAMSDSVKTLQAERRKLHNQVLELKGNIRVFARIRPISENEKFDEPTVHQ